MLWHHWLGSRKGIWPVKTECLGAVMVICLGQGTNLHMAQLMPPPLTIFCRSKSRLVLPFWYQFICIVPDKGPLNGCFCCCCCSKATEWQVEYTTWNHKRKSDKELKISMEYLVQVLVFKGSSYISIVFWRLLCIHISCCWLGYRKGIQPKITSTIYPKSRG